jgi:hypothetical protein
VEKRVPEDKVEQKKDHQTCSRLRCHRHRAVPEVRLQQRSNEVHPPI